MRKKNMRRMRLVKIRHFPRTHHIVIILVTLGYLAEMASTRRTKQLENRGIPRVPYSPRRNTVKEILRYNSNPLDQYNYQTYPRRTQDLSRTKDDTGLYLRSPDELPFPPRRGTSSTIESFRPTSTYSSSSSQFDNTSKDNNILHNKDPSPTSVISSELNRNNNRNPIIMSNEGANRRKQKKKFYPARAASVNSILRLDPEHSLWDESTAVCRAVPGLTKEQMEMCFKNPETTKVALQGLSLAADECAYQMSKSRWNCSALQGRQNPHSTVLFKKGYRESAFGHAISSAGVAYSVAKACSQGNLLSCGCGFQYDDQVNYIPSKDADYGYHHSGITGVLKKPKASLSTYNSVSSWKWSGCSHNMDYGVRFAKFFLDSREKANDLPSRINLHNNRVGRMVVSTNMEVRCKCHGLSGSCELRTCWRSAPDFRQVGAVLKNKFRRAVMIDHSEFGNRPLNRVQKAKKQRRKRRDPTKRTSAANVDLWYYERSPTYCESNSDFSIPGTSGRVCNRTGGREPGSCSTLCCGRGYSTIRQVYTKRCNCTFHWCCHVECKNCTVDEYITVCK